MSKKEFKGTAEFFISGAEGHQEEKSSEKLYENVDFQKELEESQKEKAPSNLKKIKGYVIDPKYYMETKSQRVQILLRPSTLKEVKKVAKKEKTSMNEIINRAIEKYLEVDKIYENK